MSNVNYIFFVSDMIYTYIYSLSLPVDTNLYNALVVTT